MIFQQFNRHRQLPCNYYRTHLQRMSYPVNTKQIAVDLHPPPQPLQSSRNHPHIRRFDRPLIRCNTTNHHHTAKRAPERHHKSTGMHKRVVNAIQSRGIPLLPSRLASFSPSSSFRTAFLAACVLARWRARMGRRCGRTDGLPKQGRNGRMGGRRGFGLAGAGFRWWHLAGGIHSECSRP